MELPEDMVGLPVIVATPSDIGRMLRELEAIDNELLQKELSGKQINAPKLSTLINETVSMNKIDVTNKDERKKLQNFLGNLKQSAPVLHMSFSADPTVAFMGKLLAWLRREIHPLVLVSVGLQPNLGAGCVVRSTNKYFDLSLRKNFDKSKSILLDKLSEINGLPKSVASQPVASRSAAPHAQEVHA